MQNTALVATAGVTPGTANLPASVQAHGLAESAASGQYLTFSLQSEVYGLDILRVREILEYTRPTTIPMMPAFVHGVINLRGNVVPVIDLAQRFGRPATELRQRTCIVIMEVDGDDGPQAIGVLVDAVNAVLDMDATQIEPPPSFGTGLRQDFIRGMARTDSGFIILLDVSHVLSMDEMAALARVADGAAHSDAKPALSR
ncbi:chemotaxis protein CheW [Thiomonas delicata]|jgi:purine-binding chemotaxis protein CheW|uniref:Signal transduction chemotaxis protein n=1 Tax=Thiomonas delicata TaxID=364030 RepID=A0A238D814_THIDL|nr:chemotaxis protein CheW [Thiomonas delicata]SBP89478.1 Signal transduction chemotaxis protein [Thiomonas delicata]